MSRTTPGQLRRAVLRGAGAGAALRVAVLRLAHEAAARLLRRGDPRGIEAGTLGGESRAAAQGQGGARQGAARLREAACVLGAHERRVRWPSAARTTSLPHPTRKRPDRRPAPPQPATPATASSWTARSSTASWAARKRNLATPSSQEAKTKPPCPARVKGTGDLTRSRHRASQNGKKRVKSPVPLTRFLRLHVLQQDGVHRVGGVLARVAALLHTVEYLRPHQHAHGVLAVVRMQFAMTVMYS